MTIASVGKYAEQAMPSIYILPFVLRYVYNVVNLPPWKMMLANRV